MSLGTHACALMSDGRDAYLYGYIYFFDDPKASQSDRENQIRIHHKALHPRYLILTPFARGADGDGGSGGQIGGRATRRENRITSRLLVVML